LIAIITSRFLLGCILGEAGTSWTEDGAAPLPNLFGYVGSDAGRGGRHSLGPEMITRIKPEPNPLCHLSE